MMTFHVQHKTPIILSVLLIAIGSIVWYGVRPLQHSLEEKRKSVQEFYVGKDNREQQISKLPELEAQYQMIVDNEQTIDILMAENETVDFVKEVERLAEETGVEMNIVSKDGGKIIEPKKPVAKPNPTNAKITIAPQAKNAAPKVLTILETTPFDRYLFLHIKAIGQYRDIVAFLGKIETLPFGLDVIKVEMLKQNNQNKSQSVTKITNPFAVSKGTVNPAVVTERVSTIIEATFDVLVYVKKN